MTTGEVVVRKKGAWQKFNSAGLSFLNPITTNGCTLNMINQMIGMGCFFLPFILKTCGVITGSLIIIAGGIYFCILYNVLFSALNKARKLNVQIPILSEENKLVLTKQNIYSLESLAYITFGKYAFWTVKIIRTSFVVVLLIIYQIMFIDMIVENLQYIFNFQIGYPYGRLVVGGVLFILLHFMCMFEKLKRVVLLKFVSTVVNISFFFILLFLLFMGYTDKYTMGGIRWLPDFGKNGTYANFFSMFGLVIFSYMHFGLCSIHADFEKENFYKIEMSIFNSTVFVGLFNLYSAVVGYFAFFENTQANVIFSFNDASGVAILLRILIFAEVFFTYPMYNFIALKTIDEIIVITLKKFKEFREHVRGKDVLATEEELREDKEEEELRKLHISTYYIKKDAITKKKSNEKKLVNYVRFSIETLVLTFLIMLPATFLPSANSWISYASTFCGIPYILVFPCVMILKLYKKKMSKLVFCIISIGLLLLLFFTGFLPILFLFLQDSNIMGR